MGGFLFVNDNGFCVFMGCVKKFHVGNDFRVVGPYYNRLVLVWRTGNKQGRNCKAENSGKKFHGFILSD